MSKIISIAEAHKATGKAKMTILSWIKSGKVSATKDKSYKNRWQIDADSLYAFIESNPRKPMKKRQKKENRVISIPMEATLGAAEPRNTSSRAVIIITQTDSLNLRNMLSEVFS